MGMRIGVVGSRSWDDRKLMWKHLIAWMRQTRINEYDPFSDNPEEIIDYRYTLHIVSGGAERGADALAEKFARQKGLSATIHYARWVREDGTKDMEAGFFRNTSIADDCEVLLAFWDGKSPGTRDTLHKALFRDIPVWVIKPDGTVLTGKEALGR